MGCNGSMLPRNLPATILRLRYILSGNERGIAVAVGSTRGERADMVENFNPKKRGFGTAHWNGQEIIVSSCNFSLFYILFFSTFGK